MATVAVLLKCGDFIIPPFDRILSGTTAIKVIEYIEDHVIPEHMLEGDYLKRVVRRDILMSEAQHESSEVVILGGEECVPLL